MKSPILPLALLLTGASFWGGTVDAEAVEIAQVTLANVQLEAENVDLKADLDLALGEVERLSVALASAEAERDAALTVVAELEAKVKTLRSQRDEAFTRLLNSKEHNRILAAKVKQLQVEEEETAAQLAAATQRAGEAEAKARTVATRLAQEEEAGEAFRAEAQKTHGLLVARNTWHKWLVFRSDAKLAICSGSEECRTAVGKELDAKVRGDALACMGSSQAAPVLWNTADPAVPGARRFVRLTELPGLFRSPWTVEVCDRTLPEATLADAN